MRSADHHHPKSILILINGILFLNDRFSNQTMKIVESANGFNDMNVKTAKTIVVIESDDSLRVLLDRLLCQYFNVESFKHGFEALAWLADGNEAHLILADLTMYDTSGMNFLENVKSSGMFQDIPVI